MSTVTEKATLNHNAPSRSASRRARSRMAALGAEIRTCRLCAENFARTRTAHEPRPVLRASASARLCVAGQAPGMRVHETGLPFNDASGDRLRVWMGVERAQFYDQRQVTILPMAFCFPGYDAKGGDLPPPKRCAAQWRAPLLDAHERLELMLLVGGHAQRWHLGAEARAGVTETVKRWREILAASTRPRLFPLPHPSWRNTGWLKRHPWFEAEVLPALRAAVAALTRPEARTP